ncbi:MAG: hypothetical protein H8D72_02095 [Planctomycetes bacterium]|nr:hypothetical protein [Planctomycetota bacterium]
MANAASKPSGGLVLIRITLGALATATGWSWAANEGLSAGEVSATVRGHLDSLPNPLHFWGETVLLYNPSGLAFLVSWLTLLAGVGLLIGALTRPAGCFVAYLGLHLLVYDVDSVRPLALLLIATGLGCAISRAGRRLGLDAALDGSLPGWLTWVRSDAGFLGR